MNIPNHFHKAQAHLYYKQNGSLEIPAPRTFQDVCLWDERSELLDRVRDLPDRVRAEIDKVLVLDNQPGQDRDPRPNRVALYESGGTAAVVDKDRKSVV